MLTSKFIGLAIIGIGTAAGMVVIAVDHTGHPAGTSVGSIPAPPPVVHTADWYVAHPDVLKEDDARCAGDAASIPQAACQNAATADQRLLASQLGQAAAANAAAGKISQPKAP